MGNQMPDKQIIV